MSSNRNFTCVKSYSEIFPLEHLIDYIENPEILGDIKAVFCDLLLNLFIDKEPRMLIQKPNLVRAIPKKKKEN